MEILDVPLESQGFPLNKNIFRILRVPFRNLEGYSDFKRLSSDINRFPLESQGVPLQILEVPSDLEVKGFHLESQELPLEISKDSLEFKGLTPFRNLRDSLRKS